MSDAVCFIPSENKTALIQVINVPENQLQGATNKKVSYISDPGVEFRLCGEKRRRNECFKADNKEVTCIMVILIEL